jgi:hypothetical protein
MKSEKEKERDRKKTNKYRESEISNNEYFILCSTTTPLHGCARVHTDLHLVYLRSFRTVMKFILFFRRE